MDSPLRRSLAILVLASSAACTDSSSPADRSLASVWVLSGGTYHVGSRTAPPVAENELGNVLREALQESSDPAIISVNLEEGVGGYEYVMVRRAACEVGVETIIAAADLPVGAQDPLSGAADRRGEDAIAGTCEAEDIDTPDRPFPQG